MVTPEVPMHDDMLLLLVEDEPLVALALQDTLESAGFRVLTAHCGDEGSAALASTIHDISGLITDIRLGSGPDGWRLARCARAKRADLPVVYVTGDSAHAFEVEGVAKSVLVQKPFAPSKMLSALNAVLT